MRYNPLHNQSYGCFLVVLLLCFIIPGILYWVWAGTQTVFICPHCKAQNNFAPRDSPEGKRLASAGAQLTAQQVPSEVQRRERPCPWCAEPILVEAKFCKHCQKEVAPVQ
jgi:hypothetical protein